MKCPMRNGEAGGMWECVEGRCAWWDADKGQCCIKTLALNTAHKDCCCKEGEEK